MPRSDRQTTIRDAEISALDARTPSAVPVPILEGGTGQSVALDAFTALSPTTTKGDLIVTGASKNAALLVGTEGQVLTVNAASASGVKWAANASEKAWTFISPAGSSGTFYYGGYYDFATTTADFQPTKTWGTANSSYAAHFFIVTEGGGGGGDTVIRVTGTSITDAGTRATSDTEDLTIASAEAANTYHETSKKWIGQVSVAHQSGSQQLCGYGWVKYWDNSNSDFTVTGLEATWLGGANDSGFNIELYHHKATGWTYNVGAAPTPPTTIASLQGSHVTEYEMVNGENGAWKRTGLAAAVTGSGSEGTIIAITTTANKAVELGSFMMTIA